VLFRKSELAGIQAGRITTAFRKWRRPTVVAGGTLTTSVGVLEIQAVDRIDASQVTPGEAASAGYESLEALLAQLGKRSDGELVRIRFRLKGPDPRIALRERAELTDPEWEEVRARLERLDRASATGPWTEATLEVIAGSEGVRAGDLAPQLGQEKEAFKLNVRKLKNLGLTESLGTGYRISPRGEAVLGRRRRG
jgi:hypothetical protein